jgi:SAM-dependent methyltransferase
VNSPDAYERHTSSAGYRRERAQKANVIYSLCGRNLERGQIADLGAGTGLVKRALEERSGRTIIGFEVDTSFVEARDGMVAADVLRLPVRDRTFDFLIVNHVYEHVTDQAGLFREAQRVARTGGRAYVSAGNRLAVMEPHYRLPFLSWLPGRAANAYLRASGRGEEYRDIRFLTYRPLVRLMSAAGFEVEDITEPALRQLLGEGRGGAWTAAWALVSRLPAFVRRSLLRLASPQWFFLLHKPRAGSDHAPEPDAGGPQQAPISAQPRGSE